MSARLHLVSNITIEKENETTGRILLHRVYLAIKPLASMDDEIKLSVIRDMDDLIKKNLNKDRIDFCILMWDRLAYIASTHGSENADLKQFTKTLNEMVHAMKVIAKGNTNESINH